MTKEMVINALVPENVRIAILDDGRLDVYFEESAGEHSTRSNIYLGRIIHVQNSLDACFVDYGEARHGFLPMSEIGSFTYRRPISDGSHLRIDKVVEHGQLVLVQVEKEAIGTKGARLTTFLSLAGRYLVLMPHSDTRGVSRRIEDPEQRKLYRDMATTIKPPDGMGVIVRTAGLGQPKRALASDLTYLVRLWSDISDKAKRHNHPGLLYADADLLQRVMRDYFTDNISRTWIDDTVAMQKAEAFFRVAMPKQQGQLQHFSERTPIFSHFGIEEQIDLLHSRRVPLPSGGSLVIDQTEALVAIDVNSGKMRGPRGQEENAFETNLEAAREIGRQLRLRDLGGIVVIDFIDMTSTGHKNTIEKELRESMKADKARCHIGKISTFGLCTLTRQRRGRSVRLIGYQPCPTCNGDGLVRDLESLSVRLLRRIRLEASRGSAQTIRVGLTVDTASHVQNRHRADLLAIEREFDVKIEVRSLLTTCSEEVFEVIARPMVPPSGGLQEQSHSGERKKDTPSSVESAPSVGGREDGGDVKKKRRRKRRKRTADSNGTSDNAVAVAPTVDSSAVDHGDDGIAGIPTLSDGGISSSSEVKALAPNTARKKRKRKRKNKDPDLKMRGTFVPAVIKANGQERDGDGYLTPDAGSPASRADKSGKGSEAVVASTGGSKKRRRRRRKKKSGANDLNPISD